MPDFRVDLTGEECERGAALVNFEIFCATCGAGLCQLSDTRQSRRRGAHQVTVEACPHCLAEAREGGSNAGYDACQEAMVAGGGGDVQ